MEIQNINTAPTLAPTDTLRVLADQPERWLAYGAPRQRVRVTGAAPLTWHAARAIVEAADAADGARTDRGIGDLSRWIPCPGPDGVIGLMPAGDPTARPIPMRERAWRQWCAEIGAPADYLTSVSWKIGLAAAFDSARRHAEGPALLRIAGGEARALLSDRYAPMDNARALDACERALSDRGLLDAAEVRGVATGLTTVLRVMIPRADGEIKKGDAVAIGFDLRNGEVGNASLSITPVTLRLVCLNGMTRADAASTRRLRHVGDGARKIEGLTDAIHGALDLASGLRDAQARAGEILIDDAWRELGILSSLGFTAAEGRGALEHAFSAEHGISVDASTARTLALSADLPGLSVLDLSQGATLYAQSLSTDRRLDVEAAAGAYVMRRAA